MPYPKDQIRFSTSNGATANLEDFADMPPYNIGDHALMFINGRRTGSPSDGGWSTAISEGQGEARGRVFYKQLNSLGEILPNVSGGASFTNFNVTVVIIADADATNFLDVTPTSDNKSSSSILNPPAITTTTDNSLIFYNTVQYRANNSNCFSYDSGDQALIDFNGGSNNVTIQQSYSVQETAGTKPAAVLESLIENNVVSQAIAIRDSGSGNIPAYPDGTYTRLAKNTFTNRASLTFQNWGDIVGATYDGINADTTAVNPGIAGTLQAEFMYYETVSFNGWTGIVIDLLAAQDLRDRITFLNYQYAGSFNRNDGPHILVADSLGNWRSYQVRENPADGTSNNVSVDVENGEFLFESATPPDFSDITQIGIARRNSSASNTQIGLGLIGIANKNEAVIIGGSDPQPINSQTISDMFSTRADTTTRAVSQGSGQILYPLPLKIGNGTNKTVVNFGGVSLESPQNYNELDVDSFNYNVGASGGYFGVTLQTCAACEINFSDSIIASAVPGFFEIDPTSVAPASFSTAGLQIRNCAVIWNSLFNATSMRFVNCQEIDFKAATLNSVGIENQAAGTTSIFDDGASLTNVSFTTETASNFAITIDAPGDIDLTDVTFTGFTTPIKVTATTGTVNLNVGGTTSIVPGDISSDGATVNIVAPGTDITVNSLVSTYVYLENNSGAQVDYQTSVTGTYTNTIPAGSTGTWRLVLDREGYDRVIISIVPDGVARVIDGTLNEQLNFNGTPVYTSQSNANVSIDYVNNKIDFATGSYNITAQIVYDMVQELKVSAAGMADTEIQNIRYAKNLSTANDMDLGAYQFRRASGSTGSVAVIEVSVRNDSGTVSDQSNGAISSDGGVIASFSSVTPASVAAAVWNSLTTVYTAPGSFGRLMQDILITARNTFSVAAGKN